MKNNFKIIWMAIIILTASCTKDKLSLPSPIAKSDIKFAVTQQQGRDNIVYLQSLTPGVISYWDYESGTSTLAEDTVIFPFSGDYKIKYDASSAGGFVYGDSVTIHITNTDLSFITDPSWEDLTGGQAGKTWVLDMARPIGWYGYDYLKHNGSGDDWSWHPDYAGNEWVMPNRDYGKMSFDLNNGKNYRRTYIDDNGNTVNCTGKFDLDLANHVMKIIGCEMLFGGNYHSQSTNWSNVTILDLSATSMTLGVKRDHPNPGDGPCWIGFTFKSQ